MENSNSSDYKIPDEFSNNTEQTDFWSKIIHDQILSGMSIGQFCSKHQIDFDRFHYWKYRKIRPDNIAKNTKKKIKKQKQDKDTGKLIPLQIVRDKKAVYKEDNEVTEIVFKNGNKIRFSTKLSEKNLLLLVKVAGELRC